MKRQCLAKLESHIDQHAQTKGGMFYRNGFALACLMAMDGEVLAAKKAVRSLFDQIGWDKRKTYFEAILDSLEEFAIDYFHEIGANAEINDLKRRPA